MPRPGKGMRPFAASCCARSRIAFHGVYPWAGRRPDPRASLRCRRPGKGLLRCGALPGWRSRASGTCGSGEHAPPSLDSGAALSHIAGVQAPKPPLDILLCAPRGFCAGVVRAVDAVERALALYGPPVYVRHEIVHNRYVVESLKAKGAIFVEELSEIPDRNAPVVLSAHGVSRAVQAEAGEHIIAIDATCPLVTKVHREAEIHFRRGREILLIGHAGHPEVIGTLGQLPAGSIT